LASFTRLYRDARSTKHKKERLLVRKMLLLVVNMKIFVNEYGKDSLHYVLVIFIEERFRPRVSNLQIIFFSCNILVFKRSSFD